MDAALGWPRPVYFTFPEASAGLILEVTLFWTLFTLMFSRAWPCLQTLTFPFQQHSVSLNVFDLSFFLTFNFFFFFLSSFIPLRFAHVLFAADYQTSGVFPVLNHRPGFQLLTCGFGCSASLLAHQGLTALCLILVSTVFSWTQGSGTLLLSLFKKNNVSLLLLFNIRQ